VQTYSIFLSVLLIGCQATSDVVEDPITPVPSTTEPGDGQVVEPPAPTPAPQPTPTPAPQPAPEPALTVTADLFAVASVAADDVYVAGATGTLLHYDGTWAAETSPTTNDLSSIWATSGGRAWAVGAAGTILRRDTAGWHTVASPTSNDLNGVWAAADDDAWAVGSKDVLHWDGAAWTLAYASPHRLNAVWGRAANDVWAVGSGHEPDGDYASILLHWDGSTWTESFLCNPEGTRFASGGWNSTLVDVMGAADGSLWSTGSCGPGAAQMAIGYVADTRSGSWGEATDAEPYADYHHLRTIWASSRTDVWAASSNSYPQPDDGPPTILHFDGTTWTPSSDASTVDVFDLSGTSSTDVWAVGKAGKRLHFDGTTWSP
jgi:hypothetical protein